MNIRAALCLLAVLITNCENDLFAQWTSFSVEGTSGIQANSVRDIVEDEYGTVWFATENGVFSRTPSNGMWTKFNTSSGLGSNDVNRLYVLPSNGRVACATDNGLYFYNGSNFSGPNSQCSYPIITSVTGNSVNNHWVTTLGGGIFRYSYGYQQPFGVATGLPTNYYRSSFLDDQLNFWFGTSNHGVVKLTSNLNWQQYTEDDGLAGNTVIDACQDAQGNIWLAGEGGLSKLIDGVWYSITTLTGANSQNYFTIESSSDGTVWAGGENGIDVFINGVLTDHIDAADGMNSNSVTSICEDSEGTLWVGHTSGGVSALVDGTWRNYSSAIGLRGSVTCMVEAANGDLLFGHSEGITRFEGTNWLPFSPNLSGPVNGLWNDNSGNLWAATGYHTYSKFNGSSWTQYSVPQNYYSSKMFVALDGTKWFYTYSGVLRLKPNGLQQEFSTSSYFFGSYVRTIAEDPDGNIWVLNDKGLFRYDDGIWNSYFFRPQLPNDYFLDGSTIEFAANGNPLVVLTSKDYDVLTYHYDYFWHVLDLKMNLLYRELTMVDVTYVQQNNNSGDINYILTDSDENLWIASGSYTYSLSGNAHRVSRIAADNTTEHYYENDGILKGDIRYLFEDSEKNIWLLTDQGASRYSPNPVGITEIRNEGTESFLRVYPNPAEQQVTLDFFSSSNVSSVSIHSIDGKMVYFSQKSAVPNVMNTITIDISSIEAGIYMVSTSETTVATKLIISN